MARARKSKHPIYSEAAERDFLETAEARKNNRCPRCGEGVRDNLALRGWVQCQQKGAPGFRKDASRLACDWDGFLDPRR